eukprot:NODE_12429_length_395_cov_11.875000_g11771_i0.p1 GENE.NODE_12429_length_395_cov_11.875000_g11771_i0~~NODE_12429_length_395_cov_11.875000_g11771_i0.p1  ORF type:complete len:121 (+),score=9.25 NODE_12429_length_395_cov_11.875000_g11771_i0:30-392(+)
MTSLECLLSLTHTFPHGRLPSDLIKILLRALSNALINKHTCGPHGGLALHSVFVDEQGNVTLGTSINSSNSCLYSPERMSSKDQLPSVADDMWAVGCISLQLMTNQTDPTTLPLPPCTLR